MEFNETIKSLRLKKGISLKDFTEGGVNKMTLLRIEKGTSSPALSTLKKIAKVLGKEIKITFINPSKFKQNAKI